MATSRCIDGWNEPYRMAEREREAIRSMCRTMELKIERGLGYRVFACVWLQEKSFTRPKGFRLVMACRVTSKKCEADLDEVMAALAAPGAAKTIRLVTVKKRPMPITEQAIVFDSPDDSRAATSVFTDDARALAQRAKAITKRFKALV